MNTPPADVVHAAAELHQACGKSRARRRMATTFMELGDRATLRVVQALTGGSYRDLTPVGQACRKHRDALAAWLGERASSEALRDLSALVLTAMDEQRHDQRRQTEALTTLNSRLRRLETELDVQQRSRSTLAGQSAVDRQFQSMAARIDAFGRKFDDAQVVTAADPSAVLERTAQQLQGDLAGIATSMAAWREETASAAAQRLEAVHQTLQALGRRLDAADASRATAATPPAALTTLASMEQRLEVMGQTLARIADQLKKPSPATRRRAKKLRASARSRPATRPTAKNAVMRQRDRKRGKARTTARGPSGPARRRNRRVAAVKRAKAILRRPPRRRRTDSTAVKRSTAPRAQRRAGAAPARRLPPPLPRKPRSSTAVRARGTHQRTRRRTSTR